MRFHTLAGTLFAVLLIVAGHTENALGGVPSVKSTRYHEVLTELINLSIDPLKTADVAGVTIAREGGTFNLEKGRLYLCVPVGGYPIAALYSGKGTFAFTPPLQVERDQLYRFYEKREMNEEFDFVLFFFADSTLREFAHKCKFTEGKIDNDAKANLKECLTFMRGEGGENVNPEIMKTLLEFQSNGLFYAHILTKKNDALFFEIDPFAEEEVKFMRLNQGQSLGHHWQEIVSQYHRRECYAGGILDHGIERQSISIKKYTISSKIDEDLDFYASAKIAFASLHNNLQWCYLQLYYDLTVDSVVREDGASIPFYRLQGNSRLWLAFDPPLAANQPDSVVVYYHGKLLRKDHDLDWILLDSPDEWFPRTWAREKTYFDLTFSSPSRYTLVSVGELLKATTGSDETTSRWVTKKPIGNASFNLGSFNEYAVEDSVIPPIKIYMAKYGHNIIANQAIQSGVVSGLNMDENVGVDIKGSLQFYTAIFGKCISDRLYATEIPASHGEAFPGLLHLAWSTFQAEDNDGENEVFRAHEVAHQWWGIGVDDKTYHDRWLSEGFSDYSGLWYMETALRDNAKFFKVLRNWKDAILGNRKFLFGSGQEAGPIWLGSRASTTTTQGDYGLIIYKKGAWVLHMLRTMLLDLKTMNEDKFKHIMKSYYTAYADTFASTYDFQRVVEQEIGIDMGWFFTQWVYGTAIPEYEFSYKTEEAPDGKYKVTCKVKQSNVADDFQMPVPLYVDFGDKKFVRLRAIVKGPMSRFELPLLPMKPKDIIFNDLEGVLCEVDNVGWEEK